MFDELIQKFEFFKEKLTAFLSMIKLHSDDEDDLNEATRLFIQIHDEKVATEEKLKNIKNELLRYKDKVLAAQNNLQNNYSKNDNELKNAISKQVLYADHIKKALTACETGDITAISIVLANDEMRLQFANTYPVHIAALFNQVEVLKLLANAGFDLTQVHPKGLTPFEVSSLMGKVETTKYLINQIKKQYLFGEINTLQTQWVEYVHSQSSLTVTQDVIQDFAASIYQFTHNNDHRGIEPTLKVHLIMLLSLGWYLSKITQTEYDFIQLIQTIIIKKSDSDYHFALAKYFLSKMLDVAFREGFLDSKPDIENLNSDAIREIQERIGDNLLTYLKNKQKIAYEQSVKKDHLKQNLSHLPYQRIMTRDAMLTQMVAHDKKSESSIILATANLFHFNNRKDTEGFEPATGVYVESLLAMSWVFSKMTGHEDDIIYYFMSSHSELDLVKILIWHNLKIGYRRGYFNPELSLEELHTEIAAYLKSKNDSLTSKIIVKKISEIYLHQKTDLAKLEEKIGFNLITLLSVAWTGAALYHSNIQNRIIEWLINEDLNSSNYQTLVQYCLQLIQEVLLDKLSNPEKQKTLLPLPDLDRVQNDAVAIAASSEDKTSITQIMANFYHYCYRQKDAMGFDPETRLHLESLLSLNWKLAEKANLQAHFVQIMRQINQEFSIDDRRYSKIISKLFKSSLEISHRLNLLDKNQNLDNLVNKMSQFLIIQDNTLLSSLDKLAGELSHLQDKSFFDVNYQTLLSSAWSLSEKMGSSFQLHLIKLLMEESPRVCAQFCMEFIHEMTALQVLNLHPDPIQSIENKPEISIQRPLGWTLFPPADKKLNLDQVKTQLIEYMKLHSYSGSAQNELETVVSSIYQFAHLPELRQKQHGVEESTGIHLESALLLGWKSAKKYGQENDFVQSLISWTPILKSNTDMFDYYRKLAQSLTSKAKIYAIKVGDLNPSFSLKKLHEAMAIELKSENDRKKLSHLMAALYIREQSGKITEEKTGLDPHAWLSCAWNSSCKNSSQEVFLHALLDNLDERSFSGENDLQNLVKTLLPDDAKYHFQYPDFSLNESQELYENAVTNLELFLSYFSPNEYFFALHYFYQESLKKAHHPAFISGLFFLENAPFSYEQFQQYKHWIIINSLIPVMGFDHFYKIAKHRFSSLELEYAQLYSAWNAEYQTASCHTRDLEQSQQNNYMNCLYSETLRVGFRQHTNLQNYSEEKLSYQKAQLKPQDDFVLRAKFNLASNAAQFFPLPTLTYSPLQESLKCADDIHTQLLTVLHRHLEKNNTDFREMAKDIQYYLGEAEKGLLQHQAHTNYILQLHAEREFDFKRQVWNYFFAKEEAREDQNEDFLFRLAGIAMGLMLAPFVGPLIAPLLESLSIAGLAATCITAMGEGLVCGAVSSIVTGDNFLKSALQNCLPVVSKQICGIVLTSLEPILKSLDAFPAIKNIVTGVTHSVCDSVVIGRNFEKNILCDALSLVSDTMISPCASTLGSFRNLLQCSIDSAVRVTVNHSNITEEMVSSVVGSSARMIGSHASASFSRKQQETKNSIQPISDEKKRETKFETKIEKKENSRSHDFRLRKTPLEFSSIFIPHDEKAYDQFVQSDSKNQSSSRQSIISGTVSGAEHAVEKKFIKQIEKYLPGNLGKNIEAHLIGFKFVNAYNQKYKNAIAEGKSTTESATCSALSSGMEVLVNSTSSAILSLPPGGTALTVLGGPLVERASEHAAHVTRETCHNVFSLRR